MPHSVGKAFQTMRETMIEIRLIEEGDLRAFAAGAVDVEVREAIEAYLLHHPEVLDRVEAYRRAAERARPIRPRHLA
jgi:hypothetical protein